MALELLVVQIHQIYLHVLDVFCRETVLTVEELNDLVFRCSHCAVVFNHDIFQGLNKTTLNITGLCGLNGSIDESLATSHSVEEEFLGSQTCQVAVLDETFTRWAVVVLAKVGQGSLAETEGYTLALYVLLTHTSHDL